MVIADRAPLNHAGTFSKTLLSPEILFSSFITVMMFSSSACNDSVAALTRNFKEMNELMNE